MRVCVVGVEERDLHDWNAKRIGVGAEGYGEGREDAVVEASGYAFGA